MKLRYSLVKILYFILFGLLSTTLLSQEAFLEGKVFDVSTGEAIVNVTVFNEEHSILVETNVDGVFKCRIPASKALSIKLSRLGYQEKTIRIAATPKGITRRIEVKLIEASLDLDIVVRDTKIKDLGMIREETAEVKLLPSVTGNLESVLPSLTLGVNAGSGGELTSQYSVRGGNYDENLIYVNDFEIFRPQLIRSGQQEGLTFPNSDLIKDLAFSSGGFEAKYGDKLSSVLNVRYKRPVERKMSCTASLLGAALHTEGSTLLLGRPFRYLLGARYKTNRYLLSSLEVKGQYEPKHSDIQTYLTYDLTDSWQLSLLSNYNLSSYRLVPESGRQAVGPINFSLRVTTFYEGLEQDDFRNSMLGIAANYLPQRDKNPYYLKFLASVYDSKEQENFDIIGRYRLSQVETAVGADNAGEEIALLGVGTQHAFARNRLKSQIYNFEHKGGYEWQLEENGSKSHFIQWSTKVQLEHIDDNLKEWERLDSAGYSIPFNQSHVYFQSYIRTKNIIQSQRFTTYLMDTYTHQTDNTELKLSGGVRYSYWTYNNRGFLSPRAQVLYKPLKWKRDISFKLASGLYFQPAFYRELRRPDGSLNNQIKSQKSAHIVAGISYDFDWKSMSEKPFKMISEVYYKYLWDNISYDLDNVKIRYSGENDSDGYIIGWDTRINGEFVPGAESWVNISFLQARERILAVQHLTYRDKPRKYVPKPTDQALFLNFFFQDYLPKQKNFKAHFLVAFGTGIAYGVKGNNRIYRNAFRYPPYRRVDIGFSYQLWNQDWKTKKPYHPLRWSRNAWVSVEAFNLLGIENVASSSWVKSIYNVYYGIPNRLTTRRINLKLRLEF